ARDLHRLAEQRAAGALDLLGRTLEVLDGNDDRWVLSGIVRFLRIEAAVDPALLAGSAGVGLGGRRHHVVAHLRPEVLGLSSARLLVELRHPIAIAVGHFEMHDAVHGYTSCEKSRVARYA